MGAPTTDAPLPPRVLLHAWCRTVVGSLRAGAVQDIIISPGSRNTPLTLSALSEGGLRCHSVVDERSAAFFALGMARATGAPVALLCTSGTAAAHYFPAVIEAFYDGIPLIVISADRPEELQNCGAAQTIQQRNLFGTFVRGALPLPSPREVPELFARLPRDISSLIALAVGHRPGPVHLNVPLRKPLEPAQPSDSQQQQRIERLLGTPSPPPRPATQQASVDLGSLLEARRSAHRPLVVAGPVSPREAHHASSIAAVLEAPLLGEFGPPKTSGLEFAAPRFRGDSGPDFLLHVGPPAVSSTWGRFLETYPGRYFVAPGTEYRDPSRKAEATFVAPLSVVSASLRDSMKELRHKELTDDGFPRLTDEIRVSAVEALGVRPSSAHLDEPSAVQAILAACPADANLILGNSLSVRLASWVWPTLANPPQPHTARGVNGIDGTVAWATGVALATNRPTMAILGDVTLAHDIGSLQLLTGRALPLVLFVVDNQGGRIFDHLPIQPQLTEQERTYWTTPPKMDLGSAAQAFGLVFEELVNSQRILPLLQNAWNRRQPTLVRVPTESETTLHFLERVRGRLSP